MTWNIELSPTRMNILVIDDNPCFLDIINIIYTDAGHQVSCISSTEQILQTLKSKEQVFDFALIDLRLQNKSGIDVAKTLKATFPSCFAKTNFIIVSHFNEDSAAAQSVIQAGLIFKEKPAEIKNYLKLITK